MPYRLPPEGAGYRGGSVLRCTLLQVPMCWELFWSRGADVRQHRPFACSELREICSGLCKIWFICAALIGRIFVLSKVILPEADGADFEATFVFSSERYETTTVARAHYLMSSLIRNRRDRICE